ncbi:MAG: lysophospholipid acyltransferase family protein [Candidatus Omnitrophica bacterium]|nr:lysophospholipid acyltransferase family protein [Candidatus Omnitrophota bacterium]
MAKQKWYRYLLYLGLEALRHIVLVLPRRLNQWLARSLGFCAYWILSDERAKVNAHLEDVFGAEKTKAEFQKIGERSFIHLAQSAIDVLCFPRLTRERVERLVFDDGSVKRVEQVLARGKGLIMITGHLGNWELLASYFRFLGYPGCLVGRRIYYEPYDRLLVNLRKRGLVSTVYRDESPRQVLSELKQNHIVGMSADQDIDSLDGVFVPFFGKPAWTPVGPAKVALASGAPIVPGFMVHENSRYHLFVEEAIWPPEHISSKEEAVGMLTEAWSQVVERYVRRFPDQWVWMHRRWKTKETHQVAEVVG